MLDNSLQARYNKLPIATYAIKEAPTPSPMPFMQIHHHREFEVMVIVEGRSVVTIDQVSYELSAGDVVLIPPYSIHSGTILPNEGFTQFCFCFDLSLLGEEEISNQFRASMLDVERVIHHSCSDARELAHLAFSVFQHSEIRDRGWEFMVRGLLLCFFGVLENRGSVVRLIRKGNQHSFSVQVLEFLERNYSSDLTSQSVARELSFSQSYFCRLFRDNFHTSFQCYLRQFRLCKARILLAQKTCSVGEAATKVGFNNLSYFARYFRELYGCSPKQFQLLQHNYDDADISYPGSPPESKSQELLQQLQVKS